MVHIATLNILSFKWQPPKLWTAQTEQQIADRIPFQTFDERIVQLQRLVRSKCPSTHIEYYIFVFIIICIACSVAFSLAARSADISMWYPLVLLLIPALLSFWTSRRHASFVRRIKKFERSLKQTLKEFNKIDNTTHRVQWSLRRPTIDDTLPAEFRSARLCLVIQLSRMPEDMPPPYQAAVMTSLYCLPPPPSYSELSIQQPHLQPLSTLTSSPSSQHLQTETNSILGESLSSQSSLLSVPEAARTRSAPHENLPRTSATRINLDAATTAMYP